MITSKSKITGPTLHLLRLAAVQGQIGAPYKRTRDWIQQLCEAGYLDDCSHGNYVITDTGRDYIDKLGLPPLKPRKSFRPRPVTPPKPRKERAAKPPRLPKERPLKAPKPPKLAKAPKRLRITSKHLIQSALSGSPIPFDVLPPGQRGFLRFIHGFIKRCGMPPTIREIMDGLKYKSTSTVNYHIHRLSEAGYLKRLKNASRGIQIVADLPTDEFGLKIDLAVTGDKEADLAAARAAIAQIETFISELT